MSHTLHRTGSIEDLKNDYILLVTSAIGYNHEGKKAAFQQVIDIVWDEAQTTFRPVDATLKVFSGTTKEDMKSIMHDTVRIRCVFDSPEKIARAIMRLGEADLGLSITVSGLIDEIVPMAGAAGFKPHTVSLSLGIHGNTECLPSEQVLELTTMCGHALIATNLAKAMIREVDAGHKSIEEAAAILAEPCACGIFNLTRARQILLRAQQDNEDQL